MKKKRKSTEGLVPPEVGTRSGAGHSLGEPRVCKVTSVYQGPPALRRPAPGLWYVVTFGQRRSTLRLDVFLRSYVPA